MYALAKQRALAAAAAAAAVALSCKCVLFSMAFEKPTLLVNRLVLLQFVSFPTHHSHSFSGTTHLPVRERHDWGPGGLGKFAYGSTESTEVQLDRTTNNGRSVCPVCLPACLPLPVHDAMRHAAVPALRYIPSYLS
ncbi:hypothetical protein BKA80DRAFT_278199 [Phyllosticta citrichinensis]